MLGRKTTLFLAAALYCTPLHSQPPAIVPVGMEQNIVADVNGVIITRQQLAEELIARKGRAQLQALVNRTMVEQACKAKGISVTEQEVQAELLSQVKASASASIQDFEKTMLAPMKTSLLEFREDVIRPRLMLEKLATAQLTITENDLKLEFAARFGEKAVCRMITFKEQRLATKAWQEIGAKPENYIRLAKQQADPALAAVAGMLAPIGRHTTHDNIEQRAFELQVGEVSEVMQTPEGAWVILLKEHNLPARTDVTFEQKHDDLLNSARERKSQKELPGIIASLKQQYQGKIKIYLGQDTDLPNLMNQYKNLAPNNK